MSVVAVQEENRDVGQEHVLSPEPVAFGEQFAQLDVADDVVAVFAGVLFVHLRKIQDAVHVGLLVPHVDLQRDVRRVVGLLHVVLLLVLVAVVVQAGHDVAQDRRCRGQAPGALAEHELPVVALAADHHAVVFVIDAVDVFAGGDEFGHDEHRELPVADLDHLGDQFDLDPFFAGVPDVRVVDSRDAVGEDPVGMDIHSERVNGNDD